MFLFGNCAVSRQIRFFRSGSGRGAGGAAGSRGGRNRRSRGRFFRGGSRGLFRGGGSGFLLGGGRLRGVGRGVFFFPAGGGTGAGGGVVFFPFLIVVPVLVALEEGRRPRELFRARILALACSNSSSVRIRFSWFSPSPWKEEETVLSELDTLDWFTAVSASGRSGLPSIWVMEITQTTPTINTRQASTNTTGSTMLRGRLFFR